MGIRVYCPNGHKLNVKTTQAGKRGICPHCGEKFDIPQSDNTTDANGANDAQSVSVDIETDPTEKKRDAGLDLSEVSALPSIPPVADPLAEVPGAMWYVHPPGGGEFGPASADMMRAWIEEGRVTRDAYVWREGWDDWALAGEVMRAVFEKPRASDSTKPVERPVKSAQPVPPVPVPKETQPAEDSSATYPLIDEPVSKVPQKPSPIEISTEPARPVVVTSRSRRKRSMGLVIGLALTVVVLGVILILVLSRS